MRNFLRNRILILIGTIPNMSQPEATIRIILSIGVSLVGLGIGLLLRRLVVRRLKKTVLDDWLIHALGIIVVFPPLIIAVAGSTGIATSGFQLLNDLWQQISNFTGAPNELVSVGKNILGSVLIAIFAIGVARTFSKLIMRGIAEHRLDLNVRILINRITFILVMLIAAFWVLSVWQVAIALPVAVLGTLTVAITFSIQDILKDLVAGIYILLEHPFFIGDQISTDKYTGKVVAVELRATRLRLVSGEDVTIPNALVFGGVVTNNSRYPERRATIMVTLPLEDFSRDETPARMTGRMQDLEGVLLKPEPTVAVSGITGERVELTVRFWVNNGQLATVTDVVYALRTLLPAADLSVKETAGDV
jgi:small-conductance mechanosensitive channel